MGWACSPVPLPRAGGHTLAGCILQCDTGKSTFPLGTALLSLGICKALRRHSGTVMHDADNADGEDGESVSLRNTASKPEHQSAILISCSLAV